MNVIYVVPWAICKTDKIFIKKVNGDTVPAPEKGATIDEWCIRNVIPNPDKRSKDIFAIVDVYNGYKDKMNDKGMSVITLNNSEDKLKELGYAEASEQEAEHIRRKVLKLNKTSK